MGELLFYVMVPLLRDEGRRHNGIRTKAPYDKSPGSKSDEVDKSPLINLTTRTKSMMNFTNRTRKPG